MSDTTPPRWPAGFNPTWIAVGVMLLINFGAIAVKYSSIEDMGQRLKALEVKDASRDVQQAEFRSDLTYIKERLSEIKAAVNAAQQPPPQVVYPQYPPQPTYPPQQRGQRGTQVAPRGTPRRPLPNRRRWRQAA